MVRLFLARSLSVAVLPSLSVAVLGALVTSGACLQVSGLDKISIGTGGGAAAPVPCTATMPCNDMNPCTTDACGSTGFCAFTALPDGPAPTQTPGNCQKTVCSAGQAHDEPDDTNVPTGTNPCVIEGCNAGTLVKDTTSKNMDPCTDNGLAGTCADGMCEVPCKTATDCSPAPANPCVTPSCDASTGFCDFTPVPDGLAPVQPQGSCEEWTCTAGIIGQTPRAADTPCSYMGNEDGFCDATGHCSECTMDSECTGNTTDCQHPSCIANVCGTTLVPSVTPTKTQTTGDCQQVVCDGMGGTMMVADPSDVPANTACAAYSCNGGTLVTTPHTGMACGTAQTCNSMGQCGCTTNADCTLYICQSGACLTSCTGDGQCLTGNYCTSGTCAPKLGNGSTCGTGDQCTSGACVDGFCCSQACAGKCQGCSTARTGQPNGTCATVLSGMADKSGQCVQSPSTSCGFNGTCNGMGDCARWPAGTTCSAGQCSGSSLTTYTQCDGSGNCGKFPVTTQCPNNFACGSNTACATACGVIPYSDGLCASNAYCDGLGNGSCQPRLGPNNACSNDDQCQDGTCMVFCN